MVYEHRERRSRLVATSTRPTPLEITATPAPLALPTPPPQTAEAPAEDFDIPNCQQQMLQLWNARTLRQLMPRQTRCHGAKKTPSEGVEGCHAGQDRPRQAETFLQRNAPT